MLFVIWKQTIQIIQIQQTGREKNFTNCTARNTLFFAFFFGDATAGASAATAGAVDADTSGACLRLASVVFGARDDASCAKTGDGKVAHDEWPVP